LCWCPFIHPTFPPKETIVLEDLGAMKAGWIKREADLLGSGNGGNP